jgi:hypothetical protein
MARRPSQLDASRGTQSQMRARVKPALRNPPLARRSHHQLVRQCPGPLLHEEGNCGGHLIHVGERVARRIAREAGRLRRLDRRVDRQQRGVDALAAQFLRRGLNQGPRRERAGCPQPPTRDRAARRAAGDLHERTAPASAVAQRGASDGQEHERLLGHGDGPAAKCVEVGGGELAAADLDAFRGWTVAVAEQAFVFLSVGSAALRDSGRGGGALVQITGGSSRRAIPGRGLWAAGAFATRALVQAAAQELRGEGIHAALLAVDATIESPKTAGFTRDAPRDSLADMDEVAAAVAFLVQQGARALTHELVVTPSGERWVP